MYCRNKVYTCIHPAGLSDFDSTPVTLTIPPDEETLGVVDFPVTIGIINDAINEVTEQVFVVQLQLISSVSQSSVDLAIRPSSLCSIIDNDGWLTKLCDCFSLPNSIPFIAIRIGFEQPNYTFTEPLFEEENLSILLRRTM